MSAEIFGHRMDDQVRAQFKRALQVGRRKSIVHNQQRLVCVRLDHLCNRADIGDRQKWIRGRLQPHDARGRSRGLSQIFRVGRVGKCKVEAEAAQDLVE